VVIIEARVFLPIPEKVNIVETAAGKKIVVNSARIHVAKQHAIDNAFPYIERHAQCLR